MTKLAIMSDLHIDINQFGTLELQTLLQVLQDQKINHLHLAGDISNDYHAVTVPFINLMRQYLPTTFHLGNHELLKMSQKDIAAHPIQVYQLGGINLVTFDGWYDYTFCPEISLDQHLENKARFWFDRQFSRSQSDPALTRDSIVAVKKVLDQLNGPVIVAMHVVPHSDFIMPDPEFGFLNAFLGSPAYNELFQHYPNITDVVFGHAHWRKPSKIIDGIRYHLRPLGYVQEWQLTQDFILMNPDYQIGDQRQIPQRYQLIKDFPTFQTYKAVNLYDEFLSAMTIYVKKRTKIKCSTK